MKNNQSLPETGFLRLSQILQLIPIGKSTFWSKVKKGEYPKPLKLGSKTTVWRVEDIRELISSFSQSNQAS